MNEICTVDYLLHEYLGILFNRHIRKNGQWNADGHILSLIQGLQRNSYPQKT